MAAARIAARTCPGDGRGDDETVGLILRTLQEVQNETQRLENQEAIIEGFGVLSGRVKGPAAR